MTRWTLKLAMEHWAPVELAAVEPAAVCVELAVELAAVCVEMAVELAVCGELAVE